MYSLKVSQDFHDDVKSTINYIKNILKNPAAAERMKDQIKIKNNKINENPFVYPAVPNEYLASKGYRFALVNNFMIFYKVIEQHIDIIRFIYGPRDWISILINMD